MRLSDLILIESELRDNLNFDLNYSSVENVECDGNTLHKYPFNSDNPQLFRVLEAHRVWLKLRALIKELGDLKGNQAFAQVAINLYEPRVLDSKPKSGEAKNDSGDS